MIGRPRFRQIPQAGWLRQGLLSCDGSWFLLFFCEGKIIRCCILSPLCCRSSPLPAQVFTPACLSGLIRIPVRFYSFGVSSSIILRINPFSHTVSPVSANG